MTLLDERFGAIGKENLCGLDVARDGGKHERRVAVVVEIGIDVSTVIQEQLAQLCTS